MPNYFLHIHGSTGVAPDDEGQDLPNLAAARVTAIEGIRSLLAEEIRTGFLDLRGFVEIADEAAAIVAVVHFQEAVELQLQDEPT
jgi:hypothetical protein